MKDFCSQNWMVLLLLIGVSCSQKDKTQSWTEGMRGMAQTYEQLIPYMYSESRFSDPKNTRFIDTKIKELIYFSNSLDYHIAGQISGEDPVFAFGLKGLKRSIERAGESFFVQSYGYSQDVLQHSFNYCVQCHTSTTLGRNFQTLDAFQSFIPPEKDELAKVQIASRQFVSAIATMKEQLRSSKFSEKERLNTLKKIVTIYVKNLKTPQEAITFLKDFSESGKFSRQKNLLRKWKRDLEKWDSRYKAASYKEVLVDSADFSKDISFIENLYRSIILHQSLNLVADKTERAKILFVLGQLYIYAPINFSELPDLYFESCIYEKPNTKIAKRCYYSLEKRIRSAYNLGPGGKIPQSEKDYLINLKTLSEDLPKPSGSLKGQDQL